MSTQRKVTSERLIEKIVIAAVNDSDLRARLLEDPTEDVKQFLKENGFPTEAANIRFVEEGTDVSASDDEVVVELPQEMPSKSVSEGRMELSEKELEAVAGGAAESETWICTATCGCCIGTSFGCIDPIDTISE